MKKEVLLIMVSISLFLHNLEEGLVLQNWMQANLHEIPHQISILIPAKATTDLFQKAFILALGVVTMISWTVAYLTYVRKFTGVMLSLMVLVSCMLILNSLQHVGLSIFLKSYTPGVATAILLNLPVNYFFLKELMISGTIKKGLGPLIFAFSIPMYLVFLAAVYAYFHLVR